MKLRNSYFILRHGQTAYQVQKNKKSLVTYPSRPEDSSVKLTGYGREQIKRAAKELKKKKIDLIFSSDFYRTRQTAGIVAKELKVPVIFNSQLRDINLGIYCGGPKEKFYQDFPVSKERFSKRPKKGESWNDVKKRVVGFIKKIDKRYFARPNFSSKNLGGRGKNILIVSHGDPLWLLEGAVKGLSQQELLEEIKKGKYIKVGELRRLN